MIFSVVFYFNIEFFFCLFIAAIVALGLATSPRKLQMNRPRRIRSATFMTNVREAKEIAIVIVKDAKRNIRRFFQRFIFFLLNFLSIFNFSSFLLFHRENDDENEGLIKLVDKGPID
jgi:hypothetical protein